MRLLLDTCVFLWFICGDERLPASVCKAIRDSKNDVFLSSVSLWECTVKHQLGKLPLPGPPAEFLPAQRKLHKILPLPLDESSVFHLTDLPSIHRDPFDRMLICQAIEHELILSTVDDAIRSYPVKVFN